MICGPCPPEGTSPPAPPRAGEGGRAAAFVARRWLFGAAPGFASVFLSVLVVTPARPFAGLRVVAMVASLGGPRRPIRRDAPASPASMLEHRGQTKTPLTLTRAKGA